VTRLVVRDEVIAADEHATWAIGATGYWEMRGREGEREETEGEVSNTSITTPS